MKDGLKRSLGLIEIFAIASGAMVSSGLFVLPGIAYELTGPSLFLSYLLAGLLAIAGMVSQAELVSAMPRAGGDYFYVTRTLGPAAGAMSGLLTWASLSFKSAFALIGMATFLNLLVPVNMHVAATILTLFFVALNIIGTREASLFQVVLVAGLLLLLGLYVFMGIGRVRLTNFEPFAFNGLAGIVSAAGMVFIAFGGLLKVASVAEEARDPGRNIPIGMFLSFAVITTFYFLVVFVTVGVLGDRLAGSMTPITDGAAVVMGNVGSVALSLAAVLAFVSTANAGIMAAARYPLALSRDGLLPPILGKISRFNTPHVAITATGLLIIASLIMPIKPFVKAASSVLILSYAFACISLLIMRLSGLQNYRPRFRAPLFPYLQIAGLIGYLAMLVEMGAESIGIAAGIALVGLIFYLRYGAGRPREFALLHLIARITDRQIATRDLEKELFEIVRERDSVQEDRFDRLVKSCRVLDLDGPAHSSEIFRMVAEMEAPEMGIDPAKLVKQLEARERESSTAITDFIAIPHMVIEGKNVFRMVIVRVRNGVYFSESMPSVKAIFFLMGSRDERQFHLQALAAIAQIVDEPDFEERWLAARDAEGLRDVLLLSRRKRFSG